MSHAPLTEREYAVLLECVVQDGSCKRAAHALGVTTSTIKNHRANIYRKLGVTSIVGAMRVLGWVRVS